MAQKRNKQGQFTSEKPISTKILKELQKIADDAAIRIKPIVRDELQETLHHNMYASWQPATSKGQEITNYNETHKHQKKKPYHHTGTLIRNTHAIIDGDTVKVVIDDETYDNGRSTIDVYKYLKFGTPDVPTTSNIYDYNYEQSFSKYIAQEPHNFEAQTRKDMKVFLEKVKSNPEKFIGKYRNKRV